MSTSPRVEHELHQRRRSRNVGLGITLGAFVLLVMGMTYVKLTAQNAMMAEERAKEQAAAAASDSSTQSSPTAGESD